MQGGRQTHRTTSTHTAEWGSASRKNEAAARPTARRNPVDVLLRETSQWWKCHHCVILPQNHLEPPEPPEPQTGR